MLYGNAADFICELVDHNCWNKLPTMRDSTCALILIPVIFVFILNLQFLFLDLSSLFNIQRHGSMPGHDDSKAEVTSVETDIGHGAHVTMPLYGGGMTTTVSQVTPILPGATSAPTPADETEPPRCKLSSIFKRQDCGFKGITEDQCVRRNCCWEPTINPFQSNCHYAREAGPYCGADETTREQCGDDSIDEESCKKLNCCFDGSPSSFATSCFYNRQKCDGYRVLRKSENETSTYLELGIIGDGCAVNGKDVRHLSVLVSEDSADRIRIKIAPQSLPRWEIPQWVLPDPPKENAKSRLYTFDYNPSPFTFHVRRTDTDETIFDTNVAGLDALVFEDRYLQIATTLPTEPNIYGLGEVASTFRRPVGTTATMWNADQSTPEDENMYGSHPFYMELRDGKAHGVFLRNSNGQDIMIKNNAIVWKALGGVFDFQILLGPRPVDVAEQYTRVVGRPRLPPMWALGFMQSRWGYNTVEDLQDTLDQYIRAELPLDLIWNDIDYMDNFKMFTWDPKRYPIDRVKEFVDLLHSQNRQYGVIVDPGIAVSEGDKAYESGLSQDLFVKDFAGHSVVASVWPGKVHFPDWFNPATPKWWESRIAEFFKSGPSLKSILWIDMNEVSNFCHGDVAEGFCAPWTPNQTGHHLPAPEPPYVPQDPNLYHIHNRGKKRLPLHYKTMPIGAVHAGGLQEWDVHNLYGHLEALLTRQALLNIRKNERPFLLSRSSFAGSGRHTFHWNGDNHATWRQMWLSIPMTMNMNLFGIPLVGSDICGFAENTTEELCGRWQQLGAFYPFSRNHNILGAKNQAPYVWESVRDYTVRVMKIRYSLLPYFYTLLYEASVRGSPVWAPLWYYHPDDSTAYDIDKQVMIGEHLLLTPVLEEGITAVTGYFPRALWYSWADQQLDAEIHADQAQGGTEGEFKTVFAPRENIPLHLRGGGIIPIQEPKLNVPDTFASDYSLVIGLDENGNATGSLYIDDGKSEDVAGLYTYVSFAASKQGQSIRGFASDSYADIGQVTLIKQQWGFKLETKKIDKMVIMGIQAKGRDLSAISLNGKRIMYPRWEVWDDADQVTIYDLAIPLTGDFELTWEWK